MVLLVPSLFSLLLLALFSHLILKAGVKYFIWVLQLYRRDIMLKFFEDFCEILDQQICEELNLPLELKKIVLEETFFSCVTFFNEFLKLGFDDQSL